MAAEQESRSFAGDNLPDPLASHAETCHEPSNPSTRYPGRPSERPGSPTDDYLAALAGSPRRAFEGSVVNGKSSVRNGVAGRPSWFQKLTTG